MIPSQAIQDHVATFQLISNHSDWLDSYESSRELYSDPAIDKEDNSAAILQATFEALAAAKQLRIKQISGFTGLGYERKWYNEIQVLDQQHEVVETIVGFVAGGDIHTIERLVAYEQEPVLHWVDGTIRPNDALTQVVLILPVELPHYPEFRDENGHHLDSCSSEHMYGSFHAIVLAMDKEFLTKEVVTEEMRQEKVRAYTIQQCKNIKEDLMMNRWHPSRVERLLLAGYDIEDM